MTTNASTSIERTTFSDNSNLRSANDRLALRHYRKADLSIGAEDSVS
jgi:hypothetical protein